MTTVKLTAHDTIEIKSGQTGRVVTLPIANFCALDPDFHELAARAQANPLTEILVPSKSFNLPRPRNSRVYAIAQ